MGLHPLGTTQIPRKGSHVRRGQVLGHELRTFLDSHPEQNSGAMSYSGGGGYDQHRDYGGRSASQDEPRGDFTRRQDYDPTGDGARFSGMS
ncbi:hypothetical protein PF005_g19551 [Phytophthora fragariae]|uniref:Uncharacterized protein n=2 Tax=Phytophthora fragariae TaxID=53985 RepID=A0A6A3WRM9_9STRA|nr:hypothetical protein PF003_g40588 [Phytophthora fragariae]KAE9189668.1 hypothetical protein PF005_g19551 [Phytophthora fragariae]